MPIPVVTHALTVREPWAWALTNGFKTVENRTWAFPAKRHPMPAWIAIHAGLSWEHLWEDAMDMFALHPTLEQTMDDERGQRFIGRSEIVGVVRVAGCVNTADPDIAGTLSRWEPSPRQFGDIPIEHWIGGDGFAWVIDDCYRFRTPIVCIGRLNVWSMGDVLTGLVNRELAKSVAEQASGIDRGEVFRKSLVYQMPKIPKKQQVYYHGITPVA